MVIGDGLIANRFLDYKDNQEVLIFASGVSNSKETRQEEFQTEFDLVSSSIENNKNSCFVYFSTCSIYDAGEINSPYVQHKIKIEKYIADSINSFRIFRVTQTVGQTGNKNNILNFLIYSITNEKEFDLWNFAFRNLIDIDHLYQIVNYIICNNLFQNRIINVAGKHNISVLKIVRILEKMLNKKAVYKIVNKGSDFKLDLQEIETVISELGINFDNDYVERTIFKYHSQKNF